MGKDRSWPGKPFISWVDGSNDNGETRPSSLRHVKHLAETSPESMPKKFFYKSSYATPLKYASYASEEGVVKQIEYHTTWANVVLKAHKCRLIGDLCKSLGDGLTLVNLVQSIVEEKVAGAQYRPIIKAQKVENVERCLKFLASKGVDTSQVTAEGVYDGDMKSTLALMEGLQKLHNPPISRPSSSKSQWQNSTLSSTLSSRCHGLLTSQKSHPFYSGPDVSKDGVGREILPGIMADQDEILITSVPNPIVSTTEFDSRGVTQHVSNEKRQLLLADVSYRTSKARHRLLKNDSHGNSSELSHHHDSASGVPRAFVNGQQVTQHQQAQPFTVEERLKNLLNTPPIGVSIDQQDYEDGELLLPPVPAKRPQPVAKKYGGQMFDNPALDLGPDEYSYYSADSDYPRSSYVPSRPTDKRDVARGEALLDKTTMPTPELPHRERNGDSGRQTTGVKGRTDGASNDLRNMCNKMYSKETRPGQSLNIKTAAPPPYDMAMRNRNPFYQRPDPSGHSSPHGSLSSGQTVSSSQESENKMKIADIQMVQLRNGVGNARLDDSHLSDYDARGQASGQSSRHDSHSTNRSASSVMNQKDDTEEENSVLEQKFRQDGIISEKAVFLKQQKDQIKRDHEVEKKRQKIIELRRKSITDEESRRQIVDSEKLHKDNARTPRERTKTKAVPFMGRRASSPGKMPVNNRRESVEITEEDSIFMAEDLASDENDIYETEGTSRSVTPPLPPLSPTTTPPESPRDSPTLPVKYKRSMSACAQLGLGPRPDLLKQTSETPKPAPRGGEVKKKKVRTVSMVGVANTRGKSSRPSPTARKSKSPPRSQFATSGTLSEVKEDNTETEDGDMTATSQEWSDVAPSPRHSKNETLPSKEVQALRNQLSGLENMYSEILKIVDRKSSRDKSEHSRHDSRRNSIAGSVVSQTSSRYSHGKKLRRSNSLKQRHKELKHVHKRFARLESHVVTLARSVAHLSSEMRSQNSFYEELDAIRHELQELRESPNLRLPQENAFGMDEFQRFRGWVPSLTNPKRVDKLTKFFGVEPPLLQMFLKRLGYERYSPNFEKEHIGMSELPYMNEDRLKSIGIPMGPRLRILQEAQMCFRQENFNIYIV